MSVLCELLQNPNVSLETIQLLLKEHPEALHKREEADSILEQAFTTGVSLSVIQLLFEQWTEFHYNASRGYQDTCLHKAITCRASLPVVKFLTEKYPDVIKSRDEYARLPLHLACKYKLCIKTIEFLIGTWPSALRMHDYDGYLPLHEACRANSDFEVIALLIKLWPDSLQERNFKQQVPLHVACQNNCDAKVAALMIEHCPRALKSFDDYGRLPLNNACSSSSLETVKVLIQAFPESLQIRTTTQRTIPLHEACMSEKTSQSVIDYLLECFPDAIQVVDIDKWLPLHWACRFHNELGIVKRLVEAWPDALHAETSDGRLPVHVACHNKGVSLDIIRYLIESHPAAVQIRDNSRQLPLHWACENQLDLEIMRCLVRAWPDSVSQQATVDDEDMCRYYSELESYDSRTGETVDESSYDSNADDDEHSSMDDDVQSSMDDEDQSNVEEDDEFSIMNDDDELTILDDEANNSEVEGSVESSDEVDDESAMTGDNNEQSSNDDHGNTNDDTNKQYRCLLPLDVSVRMHLRQNHQEGLGILDRGLNTELVDIVTNGMPPLHFASMHPCTLWYPFRINTLQCLSLVTPEEDWTQFYQGMLPFHYACRAGAPQSVLKFCHDQYPDAAQMLTMDTSDSPLHCYLSSWSSSNQINLTTAATNMTTSTTTKTRHTMRAKPTLSAVQYLIKKHRDSLHSPNRHGFLPLHVAAICDIPLDILFYLACEYPETVTG